MRQHFKVEEPGRGEIQVFGSNRWRSRRQKGTAEWNVVEEMFKSGLVLATLKLFVLQRHSTLCFACLWIRIHTQQWDNEPKHLSLCEIGLPRAALQKNKRLHIYVGTRRGSGYKMTCRTVSVQLNACYHKPNAWFENSFFTMTSFEIIF